MLRVGIGKSKNMAKNGRKFTRKERPVMNPLGSVNSKRGVQHFDACPKIHKYAQKIIQDSIARSHTTVFDIWDQQSMIGRDGWGIIKLSDTWIDA